MGTAAGAGLVIQPVAGLVGVVLGVRSLDTLVPMAGAGLIAIVAAGRWAATRARDRRPVRS